MALLLVVAPAVLAKGASAATTAGPGLERPISLREHGQPGSEAKLAELSDQTGLFAVMFGDAGDQLFDQPPAGDLGARYAITYAVPGEGATFQVVQDLYPYAAGGPVTHARSGQRLWAGQEVVGGWFYGPATLLPMLVSLGLPARAPVASPAAATEAAAPATVTTARDGRAWWAGGGAAAVLLLTAAGLALRSVRRRRPGR